MDARFVFFNPEGRTAPSLFGQGFIVLTGVCMIVQIAAVLVSPAFGLMQYAMIFPYLCVFAKRLHDAGQSAWWYVAFLAGYMLLNVIFGAITLPLLSPDAYALQAEFQVVMQQHGMARMFEVISERAQELQRLSVVSSVASFLLSSAVLGFIALRLKQDAGPNKYGVPLR